MARPKWLHFLGGADQGILDSEMAQIQAVHLRILPTSV
jgi:hypothetical protein